MSAAVAPKQQVQHLRSSQEASILLGQLAGRSVLRKKSKGSATSWICCTERFSSSMSSGRSKAAVEVPLCLPLHWLQVHAKRRHDIPLLLDAFVGIGHMKSTVHMPGDLQLAPIVL